MGKYTGELKGPPRTVRFTDTEVELINKFCGDSFNKKLSNLITFAAERGLEEIEILTEEINLLHNQRQELVENIRELEMGKKQLEASLDYVKKIGMQYNPQSYQQKHRMGEISRSNLRMK